MDYLKKHHHQLNEIDIYTETIQLKALRKARENDLIQKNQSQEREIICKNINSIENTILDLQRITDDLPYNLKNILKVFNKILEEEIIRLNERLKRI